MGRVGRRLDIWHGTNSHYILILPNTKEPNLHKPRLFVSYEDCIRFAVDYFVLNLSVGRALCDRKYYTYDFHRDSGVWWTVYGVLLQFYNSLDTRFVIKHRIWNVHNCVLLCLPVVIHFDFYKVQFIVYFVINWIVVVVA